MRGKEFNEIYDLVGVRVLVDSLRDCYAALGAVHALWKPIPGRFKDYIAMPKSNMYQSLHTTVVGPGGKPLEIQIRTRDMHRTAQVRHRGALALQGGRQAGEGRRRPGVARPDDGVAEGHGRPARVHGGSEDRPLRGPVFVFTPKGDVVNLPEGATPVDFAYAIHTDVGHRTIGAKVGGKLVPLDYELADGRRRRRPHLEGPGRGAVAGLAAVRGDATGTERRSASGSREDAARTRWSTARTPCSG